MDPQVRNILETVERYKAKADVIEQQSDGSPRHTLMTRSPGGSLLYLYLPPRRFVQPPRILEERYGLSGLAGHYKMPEGLKAADLESYAQVMSHAQMRGDITNREMQKKLQDAIDLLAAHNPELKNLKPGSHDFDARFDILMGVASDFNVKDIQFYLDGNSGGVARQNPAWAALESKIQSRVPMAWIPSMDTMQKIDAQTEQRVARKPRLTIVPSV